MATSPRYDRARRCLPAAEWPAPDRLAWFAALAPSDPLEDGGLGQHWSEATRRMVASGYGRWLTFLTRHDWLAPASAPLARVTPERVDGCVAELRATVAPVTVHNRIVQLQAALRVIGPDVDLPWLRRLERRLATRAVPVRAKEPKLRAAAELFALGVRLMDEVNDQRSVQLIWRAARYRDGLMIALLAARPVRLRNFAGTRIGHNLVRLDGRYLLRFDAGETKAKRHLELPVPDALTAYLDRYLAGFRPAILRERQSDRLWTRRRARR